MPTYDEERFTDDNRFADPNPPANPEQPAPTFPRLAVCDPPETTPGPNAPYDPAQCEYPRLTGFDAILEAYAHDPERWDGLE